MSETSNEESVTESAATTEPKQCSSHSACKPHTSLYLSVVALMLAAYAAYSAATSTAPVDGEARLESLEYSVQNMNEQIIALGKDVESNRDNLIQNQLKKALLNIQEISGLAKEETKATIAEIEQILQKLTSPIEASEEEAKAAQPAAVEHDAEPESMQETAPQTQPTEQPTADTAVQPVEKAAEEAATEAEVAEPETPAAEDPAIEVPADQPEEAAPMQPEAQAF